MTTDGRADDPTDRAVASRRDAARWDAMYGTDPERVWSGAPNGSLVTEVRDLSPGRVLDVGCGEGADAIWLARRGWSVTAVDISSVAVERARSAAAVAGVDVDWRCVDVLAEPPAPNSYDLVSLQYPALPKAVGSGPIRSLLAAVAPGGTVLMVGHAGVHTSADGPDGQHDHHEPHEDDGHHGDHSPGDDSLPSFDPSEFVAMEDIATLLVEAGFDIEVDEVRPRPDPPPDAHHVDDAVLRARRPARSAGDPDLPV